VTVEIDPVCRAVETLSAHVSSPPPPRDLRVGMGNSRRIFLRAALAAAALVIAVVGVWLILNRIGAPGAPASPQFVLEHLRVRGKPVEPRVMEVRGADALVLMAPRFSAAGAEPKGSVQAPAALMIGGVIPTAGRH